MNGFQVIVVNDVRCHTGMPTCDAAHAALLGVLNALDTTYLGPTATLSKSQKGNLGEFITYHIANSIYPASTHLRLAGNALNPLSGISGAGLDLVYVHLDPTTPTNDVIYMQEVKTTGAADLDYFDALKGDFKKLFGPDPQLTLQSRIRYVQNILEFERDDLAASRRVAALAATSPMTSSRVRLIPTGISGAGVGTPSTKLDAIRSSIAAFGWPPGNIMPWSIVMSDLENRLIRLSRGLP